VSHYDGGYPPPPPGGPGGPPPGPMGQAPGGMTPPPPNHLVWAILTTLFCCLPLGIVSIVFSAQVNSKWQMGDVAGAQESAEKAKQFAIWAAVVGAAAVVLYIVLAVAGVLGSMSMMAI